MKKLTIATRQSPLALWQANFVKDRLIALYPTLDVSLLTLVTRGDKILDTPLAKIGGKGLFVKELEQALFDGTADMAVHSLKDVPMVLPAGLTLGAYLSRHAPTDAFVSNKYNHINDLPQGAVLGTSSLRRECQIRRHRPDLVIRSLRGNVGTRLAKLDDGEYDGIILATSGLQRLQLDARIRHELDTAVSLPAVGQGALAIECRADDMDTLALLAPLNDEQTCLCVLAERAMNHALEGGCQVPIAGFATLSDGVLSMEGRVGTPDGNTLLIAKNSVALGKLSDHPADSQAHHQAHAQSAIQLGQDIASDLKRQGADDILKALYA